MEVSMGHVHDFQSNSKQTKRVWEQFGRNGPQKWCWKFAAHRGNHQIIIFFFFHSQMVFTCYLQLDKQIPRIKLMMNYSVYLIYYTFILHTCRFHVWDSHLVFTAREMHSTINVPNKFTKLIWKLRAWAYYN